MIDTSQLKGSYFENEPLARYSSWKIGGPAERLYKPYSVDDLLNYLQQLPKDEHVTWLGLGSNTLVRDKGLKGSVVVTQGMLTELDTTDGGTVRAEAGLSCAQVARFSARHGLRGLEFFAGIPGTVGGALRMNAGAYGGETWDFVESVEVLTRDGKKKIRHPADYQVEYRAVTSPEPEWFLAATFKLTPGDKQESLTYIKEMLSKRNASQPTNQPNGGSVFRNPPGDYSARLIEACGLKGYRIGGACVSPKHANFIVNDEGATASDVEHLIEHVAKQVKAQHGVELVREVHIIGEAE